MFFALKVKKMIIGALTNILRFLQYQKDRVEQQQITGATLRNFVKPIKLFCEMWDIPIKWNKITRGLPKQEDTQMIEHQQ